MNAPRKQYNTVQYSTIQYCLYFHCKWYTDCCAHCCKCGKAGYLPAVWHLHERGGRPVTCAVGELALRRAKGTVLHSPGHLQTEQGKEQYHKRC